MSVDRPSGDPVLLRVRDALEQGQAQEALGLLKSRRDMHAVRNARAVCYLRLGRAQEAIEELQLVVVQDTLVNLAPGQPLAYYATFATALLATSNVEGCERVLDELGRDQDPSIARLRAALTRWRAGLGWWSRLMFRLYGSVKGTIELDGPPGELLVDDQVPRWTPEERERPLASAPA